jgi:hypothetical protein
MMVSQLCAQHSRIVDEDQRRTESLGGTGDTRAHARLVAHVDGEGLRRAPALAHLARGLRSAQLVQVEERDPLAAVREFEGDGAAEPSRGPRDDRGPAHEASASAIG